MSHKKFLLPISLGALVVGVGLSATNAIGVSAAPVDDWAALQDTINITSVENGVSMTGTSGFGVRAYLKDKVVVDGLSFDWKVSNLAFSEVRGFSIHGDGEPYAYYAGDGAVNSCVFAASQWISDKTQTRFAFRSSHNYNDSSDPAQNVAILNTSAKENGQAGFSSADGQLVANFISDFTLNFKFEKDGEDWYKVTITQAGTPNIWGDPNYNVVSNSVVTTYISKTNMRVDADGRAYIITVGMDKAGDDDTVQFLNMDYAYGIKVTAPTKVSYKKGEDLDLTGMAVSELWKISDDKAVSNDDVTVSGYDKDTYGKQTVTVSYKGMTATFDVTVENPVTGIELVGTPETAYKYGEELDISGLKVKRTYESGDTEEVDLTAEMVSGYDKNKVGKQTITITESGKTCTYEVDVADYVTKIAVKTNPTKVEYTVGDELDVTGGQIEVTYASGEKKTVDMTKDMISGFDSSDAGEITLTVTYEGFSAQFDVEIKTPASSSEVTPEPSSSEVTPAPSSSETAPVTSSDKGEETKKTGGCGGSVVALSGTVALLALAGAAIVGYKKRH